MRTQAETGFAEHLWPSGATRLYATPGWLRANITRPGGRAYTVQATTTPSTHDDAPRDGGQGAGDRVLGGSGGGPGVTGGVLDGSGGGPDVTGGVLDGSGGGPGVTGGGPGRPDGGLGATGRSISVLAFLDKGDESGEAYDLVRTTVRWPLVFPWAPEGEAPLRAALARRPGLEAALMPSLRAVLPGYEHAVTGPHHPGLPDAAVSPHDLGPLDAAVSGPHDPRLPDAGVSPHDPGLLDAGNSPQDLGSLDAGISPHDPGLLDAGISPRDLGLLDAAVSGLTALARDLGAAACAFLYVPRDAVAVRRVLAGHGFVPIALTSRGVLRVRWADLDGYTAALRPGRGRKVRRELRQIADMGLTSREADPREGLEAVTRLRCAHLTKFGRVPDVAAERARTAGVLAGFPPESLRLVLTSHQGRDVSCLLLVRHRGTVYAALGATDPRPGLGLAHFESAYYAPIRLGMYRPGDLVDYGISHLDAKAWRGCDLRPLDAWVLAFTEDVRPVLREVSGLSFRYSLEAPGEVPAAEVGR
ncbi:hypothetical protein ABGB17_36030 [Sphaerisporangium sp. B11E5]|uniref:hypothetical protein n=1 Tax=Sphaerisporangium sp. B11E5 TaxID=3153563 RepID=UPI00325C8089